MTSRAISRALSSYLLSLFPLSTTRLSISERGDGAPHAINRAHVISRENCENFELLPYPLQKIRVPSKSKHGKWERTGIRFVHSFKVHHLGGERNLGSGQWHPLAFVSCFVFTTRLSNKATVCLFG